MSMSLKNVDLKEILEEEVVNELCHVFHEASGMIICFFPARKFAADFYPEKERSLFCKCIHSASRGKRRCLMCDKAAIDKAFRLKTPYIYTCHAGLVNFVVPLVFNGKRIGCLISGQLLIRKPTLSDFDLVWERVRDLKVNRNILRENYNKVKVFSRKNLDLAVKLLSLFANYIMEKESVYVLQRKLVSRQKELLAEIQKEEELRKKLKKAWPFLKLETLSEKDQTRRQRIAREAKHFIESHYAEPLNLDVVSEAVFLSPSYFSALFSEYTGIGFAEYLAKVRVEKAKEFLERLDLNVTEIAWKVGYEDPNYFSQVFRKTTGLRPSEYRKRVIPRR